MLIAFIARINIQFFKHCASIVYSHFDFAFFLAEEVLGLDREVTVKALCHSILISFSWQLSR